MQRLNWRWLWLWLGVLVAGCGQFWSSESPPPPTKEPTLPLFDYSLLPPSLTPNLWPWHTPTPLIAADNGTLVTSPIAVHLAVNDPACYETAVGSLICLGQVKNNFDRPVENVVVVVQLLASNGMPLMTREAYISRWILPVGSSGPYRVLFDRVPPGYAGVRAVTKTGDIASNVERRYAEIAVRQVSGTFVIDQYQISLSMVNRSAATVGHLTVTMTLLDKRGQVTGYRQMRLGEERFLKPGESLAMTLRVIPQGPETVAFDAFAEGYVLAQ